MRPNAGGPSWSSDDGCGASMVGGAGLAASGDSPSGAVVSSETWAWSPLAATGSDVELGVGVCVAGPFGAGSVSSPGAGRGPGGAGGDVGGEG